MKLAFIHPFIYRYPRGIERYTLNLSAALAQQGAEIDILTWRWPQPITWPEFECRLRIYTLPTTRYYAAQCIVPFYVAHFVRHRYDMVLIHFADYGEASVLKLLPILGIKQPWSIVFHYPYSQVPHRYHTFANKGLADRAKHLIAVSRFVADEARAFLGQECAVISHGVDLELFKPNPAMRAMVRAELGLSHNAPLLLTVSALEERKGIQWMLQALPLAAKKIPNLAYIIVGDGPYREALKHLAGELGIESQVHFLAGQTAVARFYQAADLFVILSRGEASSIVSLEALACGVPVIASCHRPFEELIKPEWGRQVDETAVEVLAETIADLLLAPEKRRQMKKAGLAHILAHHTWDRIAKQYLELLA